MKKIKQLLKYALPAIMVGILFASIVTAATVLFPSQGGTGTNTKPAKGSLLVGASSTQYAVLAVGSNGLCLVASSTATNGVAWLSCAVAAGSSNTTTTVNGQAPTVTLTFASSGQSGLTITSSSVAGAFTWTWSQPTSTDSIAGFLSAPDHTTFNAKQNNISWPIPVASTSLAVTSPIVLTTNTLSLLASGYVSSTAAGTGINVSATTGAVTINNSGVLSNVAGTGINVSNATGTVTINNSGVLSITGTSNQVSSTQATGTLTLSLPQRVDPNNPSFVAAGISSTIISASTSVSSTNAYFGAATTTGQLTIGSLNGLLKGISGRVTNVATTDYVSSTAAGTGINVSATTGAVTINNSGVLSIVGSSTIGVSNSTGTVTLGAKHYPIQWIIENPATNENDAIFTFRATSTISSCNAVNKTLGDTVTMGLGYGASRATASSSLFQVVSGTTTVVTASTTPVSITLGSTTPNNLNPLIFYTTAASSSQFTLTCFYSEN